MKTHKKSDGFSVVEALVLLIVVITIGFAGWLAWQKTKNGHRNAAQNQSAPTQKITTETKVADPYSGWSVYTSPVEKLSFKIPPNWTKEVPKSGFGDGLHMLSPSRDSIVVWSSQRTGLGGACDSTVKVGTPEADSSQLGACPYFVVLGKKPVANTGLFAVWGATTADGDNFRPWCGLQDLEGILESKSSMGYILFHGRNNNLVENGKDYGTVQAELVCGTEFKSFTGLREGTVSGTERQVEEYWKTDEGQDIRLILESARY